MKIAARLLRGYGGLSLKHIRSLPASDIQTLFFELPKLQAQETLLQLDVASYPHWSGSKNDKTAGERARKAFRQALQTQAYGPARNKDAKGRRILRTGAEFRAWLSEHGIAG